MCLFTPIISNMTDEPEVPVPDIESNGDQQSADATVEYLPARWGGYSPVSDTVDGLVADKAKVFGSEATSALVAASLRQAENDKHRFEARVRELETKIEGLRDNLESERISTGGYRGRINTRRQYKRLRRTCGAIAGGSVTAGATLSHQGLTTYALGAYAAAIILLLATWFIEETKADL